MVTGLIGTVALEDPTVPLGPNCVGDEGFDEDPFPPQSVKHADSNLLKTEA